jgi:hypothetical protein
MSKHKEIALNEIDKANQLGGGPVVHYLLASAQIHATLHLAEQQRMANLLEVVRLSQEGPMAVSRRYDSVLNAITKYLDEEI